MLWQIFAYSNFLIIDLGETKELEDICVKFPLPFLLSSNSVSPRHSVTGWQKAFDPPIRLFNVARSSCPGAFEVQSAEIWLHAPCV